MDLAKAKSKTEQLSHISCLCDDGGPFPGWLDLDDPTGESGVKCSNAILFNAFEALAQSIKDLETRLSALEQ